MTWCQCEHVSHHADHALAAEYKEHLYGINVEVTVPVKTVYGTFHVCRECAEGHMKEVAIK